MPSFLTSYPIPQWAAILGLIVGLSLLLLVGIAA